MVSKAIGRVSKPTAALAVAIFALSEAGGTESKAIVWLAKAADALSKLARTLSKVSYAVSMPDIPAVQESSRAVRGK